MAFKKFGSTIKEIITIKDKHSELNLDDGTNPHGTTKADVGLSNVDNVQQIPLTEKGSANGVAELDGSGKVPITQLPAGVQGGINVIGSWNADTNTPDLSALTLDQGEAYIVSVGGSTNLNGETNWKSKDLAVWDDSLAGNWFKIDNTDDVISVAGKTGVVTLVASDVTDFDTEVSNNASVTANTSKVSADGSIASHSDVDLTGLQDGDGLIYNSTSGNFEASNINAENQDLPAVSCERTTALNLTTTPQDITLDTTAFENNTDVVQHNDTFTERIDIKETGAFFITLAGNVRNTSNADRTLDFRLKVNGTPVKTLSFTITKNSDELVTRVVPVNLTVGTYISVDCAQDVGTDCSLQPNSVISAIRLKGVKGDKGDVGAGSSIIVQKDDITIGTTTDELNFEGEHVISAVDEGANKTTITFGSSWQPNSMPLGAWLLSGASFLINGGAGVYISMSGTADDRMFFNDALDKGNVAYDGSDLKLVLKCRLNTNGGVGDNVGLLLDYAFIIDGDNSSTKVTNVAQVNYDVSTELQDEQFEIELTTMTGEANASTLMITLTRNSTGAGADTFSGNFEIIGTYLKKA